jgi:hypothetical protein
MRGSVRGAARANLGEGRSLPRPRLRCAVVGRRGSRAGSPASGAAPRHPTARSSDLLRSESRYRSCPTRPSKTGLLLALADRASARARARCPDDRGSSGAGASGARSETPAPARAKRASGTVPHVPVRVLGADVVILAPPSASCISRRGPGLRRVRLAETAAPRARSLCWSSYRARPGSGSRADLVAAADLVGASPRDGRASVGVVG